MENKYYRYLKLPFQFDIEIPEFKSQKHQKLNIDQIPRPLINFLHEHDCQIGFAEVFRKEPGYYHDLALHLDGYEFDDHVKINFVVNNNGSKMRWWQVKDPGLLKKQTTVVGTEYYYAAESDCDLLAEAELNRPALVNAGQLHSVDNITDQYRYAFSFMIQKKSGEKLLWPEAMVLFKDYIE